MKRHTAMIAVTLALGAGPRDAHRHDHDDHHFDDHHPRSESEYVTRVGPRFGGRRRLEHQP